MISRLKIKILGAGPTGSLLALSLAKIGVEVTIYDIKSRDELIKRSRAYAITHSTRKLLQKMDLWEYIKEDLNSFDLLYFKDDCLKREVEFSQSDLSNHNRYYNSIGWIIEHSLLMDKLLNKISELEDINLNLSTEINSNKEDYNLVIAADGINSPSREAKGIRNISYRYKQCCLTTQVLIRNSKSNSSYEILRPEGPFALLPIRGDLFQIVWSDSKIECNKRIKLSNQKLLDLIATILPAGYEPDTIVGKVQLYPNKFFIAYPFFKRKFILVGEAAHCFHPIAGQGLNLCWRDIYSLTNHIRIAQEKKIYLEYLPLFYYLSRLPDVIFVALSTDLLIKIFSNNIILTYPLRLVITFLLGHSKKFRKIALDLMTSSIFKIS
tara:strand:- start:79 stop:1221 length:1143 start_codon:yes stop_codon:yes gene_type:complete